LEKSVDIEQKALYNIWAWIKRWS